MYPFFTGLRIESLSALECDLFPLSHSMTIQNDEQQSSQIWPIRIGGGWRVKLFEKRDEIGPFPKKTYYFTFYGGND